MSRSTLSRALTAVVLLIIVATLSPMFADAGDFAYGRITAVQRADLVQFESPGATYRLRIAGILVPRETRAADSATSFVRALVYNQIVRMRMERGRLPNGDLSVRLFTLDPRTGSRDVAIELLRAGLVRRQPNFDFKYRELAAAEAEARQARRGLWLPR